MRFKIVFAFVLMGASAASAAQDPAYGPPPAWVKPMALPAPPADAADALQILLEDQQMQFSPAGDATYEERAIKVTGQQGLAALGNINMAWDPQTEILTIHKLAILRDGKLLDLLAGGSRFTVLRREANLDMAMLDGTLTATIAPSGLRVGDVLEFSYSKLHHDPVMRGHSQGFAEVLDAGGPIAHLYLRALWNDATPLRWTKGAGVGAVSLNRTGQGRELLIDQLNVEPAKPPDGAPERFQHPLRILFSDFKDWAEASAVMAPLYEKAEQIDAASPLKAEIAAIERQSNDPKERAAAALKRVQQQVRYFFIGLDSGGYTPAAADLTWSRRFGDCKGKTVLLLALLHGLGIKAEPALVSTTSGDSLPGLLPQIQLFDHVIVRAEIAGKVYWLDGTRPSDRGLDDIPPPAFQWALPLSAQGEPLVAIPEPPPATPLTESISRIDMSAGPDAAAPTHMELIFRQDVGVLMNLSFGLLGADDLNRRMTQTWTTSYPWIAIDKVGSTWNAKTGEFRLVMDGKATVPWSAYDGGRQFHLPGSALGGAVSLARQPGPDRDAPYAVGYPRYDRVTTTVILPKSGLGYHLQGGDDVDTAIAGIAYFRKRDLTNGVATLEVSTRALAREFPTSEAKIAEARLRELGNKDVWIDGPVTIGAAMQAVAPSERDVAPKTSGDFAIRGVKRLAAHNFADAVSDLAQAAKGDPTNAKIHYNLGVAEAGLGHYALAESQFDQSLKIKPEDRTALMSRGRVRLAQKNVSGAINDFDRIIALDVNGGSTIISVASSLEAGGAFAISDTYWTRAIGEAHEDKTLAEAVMGRCRLRAKWGHDLGAAKADCDKAEKLKPDAAERHFSLGLLALRERDFDTAMAEFASSSSSPQMSPQARYGLGLAELGNHHQAEGDADMAAALRLNPAVSRDFIAWGFKEK
jgi:tetratricopeptide (TPR) repeat protein